MAKKWYLFLIIMLCSCTTHDKPVISFYYWKTIFKLSDVERQTLEVNNVSKLYIRYFDIDLDSNKKPFPLAPIHYDEPPVSFTVVPVVYIKNRVMLDKSVDIDDLAKKVNDFISQINVKNNINCSEIQIDCDWSMESQSNYLSFVKAFKLVCKKELSATIRLHQVKYFQKTKIPAVDSGVLMYYNMGSIAADGPNSIYDRKIAERYLSSLKKYPLQLNYALPLFSWAIHTRDGKVMGLRNKLTSKVLDQDVCFKGESNTSYKVIQDNYKAGVYYRKGDLLKMEAISSKDLEEMAEDLNESKSQQPQEILFYDLDEFNIKQYEKNIFEEVVSHF